MKTPEEMAEEYVGGAFGYKENRISHIYQRDAFLAGYEAAKQEYEAKIQELETQLENWQHNAVHGDEGL